MTNWAVLFLEDAILLDEVVDGLGLLAIDPACEGGEEELERGEFGQRNQVIDQMSKRRKSGPHRVRPYSRTTRAQNWCSIR